MVDLAIAEKYQEWKKTDEFEDLLKQSIEMRPDIDKYLIEQVLFGYFMTDVLKVPLKKSKMHKPKPEELICKSCEVFDNEEQYKEKYPHVKEIQPVNVPEGKPILELLSVEDPTCLLEKGFSQEEEPVIVDGTNIENEVLI